MTTIEVKMFRAVHTHGDSKWSSAPEITACSGAESLDLLRATYVLPMNQIIQKKYKSLNICGDHSPDFEHDCSIKSELHEGS